MFKIKYKGNNFTKNYQIILKIVKKWFYINAIKTSGESNNYDFKVVTNINSASRYF